MNVDTAVVKSLNTFSAEIRAKGRPLDLVGFELPLEARNCAGIALPLSAAKELLVNLQTRIDAAVAYRSAQQAQEKP